MAVGGLFDLDDMLGGAQTSGPAGLAGIDLGGVANQPQQMGQPMGSNDGGFGFGDEAPAEDGGDWANAFGGDDAAGESFPVDFAKPEMQIVLNSSQAG